MMSLADRITAQVASPATTDDFDIHAALASVLGGVGLASSDTGGRIDFIGADPIVPSALRLGSASGLALVAKSVAMAALHRERGGPGQNIEMDLRTAPHRLCPFYDSRWELINGYPPASPVTGRAFGFVFYPTADGRWVMPLNPYPKLKRAAQVLLDCPDHPESVAKAISKWQAEDLETAAAAAGVVMPMVRTAEQFLATEQFVGHLSNAPLVEITKIGDSEPEPLSSGATQPLDGVRALGFAHVIAGAGTGRALALHGAYVLNLWGPTAFEHDTTYMTANVGMRSSTVDMRSAAGRDLTLRLLGDADVFFANRRPGRLDKLGLSESELAAARPGIIYATNSLNGTTGPWANRVGFDQSAGSLVGMAGLESDSSEPKLSPILVVNDYIVSWLTTLGIVEALRRRGREGGSWRVHVSLTRVALWILELGIFDLGYAREIAGTPGTDHAYHDPEVFRADTPLGKYQGVTDQVRMSGTPGQYRNVLLPRGSSEPAWLDTRF
jgi:crotonobetainyl-CoA:carnitine CoA-transferase CaiB-like acyl-CoA transferase